MTNNEDVMALPFGFGNSFIIRHSDFVILNMLRTPITLVTGPLGSGKTTLLRHILARRPAKIAIVMNEFGEIAIDTKVIEGKNVRIAELGGMRSSHASRLKSSSSKPQGWPSPKRSCSTLRKHCRNAGSTASFQ
jgi:energy-coupling factor transporter ATP-binding protein EcfA2